MKLAWLCYLYDGAEPSIEFSEPQSSVLYERVVPIVYAEIVE
jgi:hypothetical protein